MEYNVARIYFRDGVVDTRIYKRSIISEDRKEHKRNFKRYNFRKEKQNRSRTVRRAKQNIYELARNGEWEWFVTLTLSPDQVNRYDYSECSKKVSKWLNNLRRSCPQMAYIIVPEMHEDGAFHFHGLFSGIENAKIEDSGHKKNGKTIYNLGRYKFGFSTLTKVENNAAVTRYIAKYVTKDMLIAAAGRRSYWCSRNIARPIKETMLLNNYDLCALWQECEEDSIYSSEVSNEYNAVLYYQNLLTGTN